ncbi:zinc finger protein draculin-like [Ochlerotatus camptorhynchus]|uniref:zinc finger protein draculin-like n=1 Tax=Ochlerotatus camptorhynchus TaxID=644619 RepID=UPI0031CFCD76
MSKETTAIEKSDLKPVKTKMRIKKTEVRQCRLCLRVVPRDDVQDTRTNESDIRQKILDAVGVRINANDKVRSVCINCLLVVDMINEFRMTCRKADLLHSTKLLMMHPGSWLSEENKGTLQVCHKLIKRNRAEMDGLFKCSRVGDGDIRLLSKGKEKEVVLEEMQDTEVKIEKMNDNEQGTSDQCGINMRQSQQRIMCDVCGMLIHKSSVENHLNRHLGIKPYLCTQERCKTAFYSKSNMNKHVISVHQKDHQRYECKICHRMLKGRVGLRGHIRAQHSKKAKHPLKTECSICGKMYYKIYIKDHMATHTGDLPYECEFCDRKFAANNNWLFHRKKYHQDELNAQCSTDNTSEDNRLL